MRIQSLRRSSATLATLLMLSVITKGAAADETVASVQAASPETTQQAPVTTTPPAPVTSTPVAPAPASVQASPVPASDPVTASDKIPDEKQSPQTAAIVPVPESQSPSLTPTQDKPPVAEAQITAQGPATPPVPTPESVAPKTADQPQAEEPAVKKEPLTPGQTASPASESAVAVTKNEAETQAVPAPNVSPVPEVQPEPEVQPAKPAVVKDPQMQESAPVPAIAFTLQSEEQKRAYASGVALAHYMLDKIEEQKALHITLNKDILLAGIADTFGGDVKMSDNDIKQTLSAFDDQVKLLTMAENSRRDEAGKNYIAEFAKQEGVKKTASGMYYLIKHKGTGDAVKNTDLAEVSYQGKLIDGTLIDNGNPGGKNQIFRVSSMAPVLSEAVKLIRKGGDIQIVIPGKSKAALGIHSSEAPEEAVLIYDVSLINVSK